MYNKGRNKGKAQAEECKMTRREMIKKLTEIKDEIAINRESELTEFAREDAYRTLIETIKTIRINYGE